MKDYRQEIIKLVSEAQDIRLLELVCRFAEKLLGKEGEGRGRK